MKHLIPQFIHDQYKNQTYQGQLYAATMFMDISGFTQMTEALMQHGKAGSEILSRILNEVFEPVINVVYYHGGFIAGFAGDAFTAIFPLSTETKQTPTPTPLQASLTIQQFFVHQGLKQTVAGDFQLAVKIGVAIGQIDWGIIGPPEHKAYFFRGEAIDACANAEHHAQQGDIILTPAFKQWVLNTPLSTQQKKALQKATAINNHFQWPKTNNTTILNIPTASILTQQKQDLAIASQFYPQTILTAPTHGEFREVVSVFISFRGIEEIKALNEFVSTLLTLLRQFDGYFNRLSFGDKGGTMLIFFGCPIGHENDLQRAYDFVLALKENYPPLITGQWRAGISFGLMYAGILGIPQRCEYTTLGTAVNLSARLMMKAPWGDLYVPDALAHHPQFSFQHQGDFYYKGFTTPLATYSLSHRKHLINVGKELHQLSMVGRTTELMQLHQAVNPIFKGQFAGITYVYGEAGIGKSRLIYEFYHSLKNVTWFNGQSDSILKQPFNPFKYALKHYFEQDNSQPIETRKTIFEAKLTALHNKLDALNKSFSETTPTEHLDRLQTIKKELTRTHSFLGAFVDLHWENSLYAQLDPKLRYENTLYAIKNLFLAESLLNPVIIEIEDLHWIDTDSLKLIEVICRKIENYPLFIVATSRYADDGHKPRLLTEQQELDIFGKENCLTAIQEINLNQLSTLDLRHLAELELEGSIKTDLLQFLQTKSQANPFFAQQLIRYLQEQDLLQWQNETWHLKTQNTDLPTSLNALLIARLDRLTQALKETVQVAAVIGREFRLDILSHVLQNISTPAKPHQTIKEGIQQQIWSANSELDYIFKHVLLREAAYQMQLKTRLKKLHYAIAEAIEILYSNTLAPFYQDLAYHYQHGENLDKAKYYLEKAADKAKDNYENDLALQLYQQLIDLGLETDKTLAIILKQTEIYELVGQWDEAVNLLDKGVTLSISTSNILREGELKSLLGVLLSNRGLYNIALEMFQRVKDISLATGNKRLQALSLFNSGVVYDYKGEYDEAQHCHQKALVIYEEIDNQLGIALVLHSMGYTYYYKGEYDIAHRYFKQALFIRKEINDKRGIALGLRSIGNVYRNKGEYNKAHQYLQDSLAIYEEIGHKSGTASFLNDSGLVYSNEGKYDEAQKCYQHALAIRKDTSYKRGIANSLNNIGFIHYYKGEYDQAFQYLTRSLIIVKKINAKGILGKNYSYLACVNIALGNVKSTLKMALLHFKNIQEVGVDAEHGRTHLAVALAIHYQELQNKVWSTAEKRLLTNITTLTTLPQTAKAYFEEAIAKSSKKNYLPTLIPALYEYGRYLVEIGQTEAGLKKLKEAKQRAKKTGRMGDVRKIEAIEKTVNSEQ